MGCCPNNIILLVTKRFQGIGKAKDSFNFHLSVRRQAIERAFSIMVRRWGIFWRPLTCAFKKWALVTTVCAKVHNVCIDSILNEPLERHPRTVEDK
jgi:hypothetical protein